MNFQIKTSRQEPRTAPGNMTPRDWGFECSKYGVPIQNNPYTRQSEEWKAWVGGHNAHYRFWKASAK